MAFDIAMIKATYARLAARVEAARKVTNKPLTASEKKSLKIMPFRQFGFLKMISFNTKLAL